MVPTHALWTLCASPHPGLVSLLFMPSLYSLFLICRNFYLLVILCLLFEVYNHAWKTITLRLFSGGKSHQAVLQQQANTPQDTVPQRMTVVQHNKGPRVYIAHVALLTLQLSALRRLHTRCVGLFLHSK